MEGVKMSGKVKRAELFARAAHGAVGQLRKYTGEPYVTHPIRVMELVRTVLPDEPDALAAALLHDVIEDTEITQNEIYAEFGPDVTEMVVALSDLHIDGIQSRKARKALDRDRLSKASASVQTIKVADMIDNTESIVAHDPKFAKLYLEEKRLLLDVLTKADTGLVHIARNQITIRR